MKGGKTFFTGTAEISFPLGLPEEFGIRGVAFTDFGTLFDTDASKYKCDNDRCKCSDYKNVTKPKICKTRNSTLRKNRRL